MAAVTITAVDGWTSVGLSTRKATAFLIGDFGNTVGDDAGEEAAIEDTGEHCSEETGEPTVDEPGEQAGEEPGEHAGEETVDADESSDSAMLLLNK